MLDRDSGRILFEQNADKRLYPASTTKIMTAILVLENLQLDSVVVASRDAVMSIPAGGSNMGILEGEQLTVEELMYGVLVESANEACNVLAEYMCGDVDSFVIKMNEKAQQLGMQNTKFFKSARASFAGALQHGARFSNLSPLCDAERDVSRNGVYDAICN